MQDGDGLFFNITSDDIWLNLEAKLDNVENPVLRASTYMRVAKTMLTEEIKAVI